MAWFNAPLLIHKVSALSLLCEEKKHGNTTSHLDLHQKAF
jgi:hypothetical protein